MAQPHVSGRVLAGTVTVFGLGLAWLMISISFPSQEELSAKEPLGLSPAVTADRPSALPEPALDLSIPGVPALPQGPPVNPSGQARVGTTRVGPSVAVRRGPRAAQVARLRCEAEIEHLCPDVPDGAARITCLEQRAQHLTASCGPRLHERFVKWKEEQTRLMTACESDIEQWCASINPDGGDLLQCLQEHGQEVSDRCYATLPKGRVYFKQ
jgi:hypothetical protein